MLMSHIFLLVKGGDQNKATSSVYLLTTLTKPEEVTY